MIDNSSQIKQTAISLRKQGKTFRQISAQLNIPLGTTHLWTKDTSLSESQLQHIRDKHQNAFHQGRKNAAEKQKQLSHQRFHINYDLGFSLISNITQRELILIGASLYWAEGFKKDSRLGFANSDPRMIKLFLKWLIEIMKVPEKDIRLRVGVNQSYKDQVYLIEKKWSEMIHIPLEQFQKPFFQQTTWKKQYPNPDQYLGVLRIRANKQIALFQQIQGMISGLQSLAG